MTEETMTITTTTTSATGYAENFNEAIVDRKIFDPERDGFNLDPNKVNWASKEFQLPTGDKLGVFKVANTSLYRVGFVSKTANGRTVPSPYDGMYTSPDAAQKDILTYLRGAWDDAERRTTKAVRKEHRERVEAEEAAAAAAADASEPVAA